MLFNSLPFIFVFLPAVAIGFFWLGRQSLQLAALWLCAASLVFYGYWSIEYVFLLLASVIFNYGAGYLIGHAARGRAYVLLSVAVGFNLALLGYYKYANFFLHDINRLCGTDWSWGTIILPLGISFFTFTQIAFLVDTYRGKVREYDLVHYLLFVTYFPHLIAGPILHHAQMMPQFALPQTYRLNWKNIATGFTIFIIGLVKKVFLADSLALIANPIFNAVSAGGSPMFFEAWFGALAYTLQLYFDFSGYIDMAIGISCLFNIRLPLNFNSPYKAANIIDFWRRWHMTLSAFLRDYLYIPLGGNRHGSARRYANLMITMLLGGLWHGAGWTFIVWGGLHGLYLMINHAFHAFRARVEWREGRFGRTGNFAAIGTTFIAVIFAWVFFRAHDLGTAQRMILGMVAWNGISVFNPSYHLQPAFVAFAQAHGILFEGCMPLTFLAGLMTTNVIITLALGLILVWAFPNTQQWIGWFDAEKKTANATFFSLFVTWQPQRWMTWTLFGILFALAVLTLASGPPSEFLYFQF